ncbi:PAP2-domain-containing protein [Pluteus cervinus]|uniref:PAP2-domain-containing protein n=1 Tax=Pluteus cervinus TaxID=181527 RepID=A0ACD3A3J7_9AGAR|nr:PAP2-domain-containing protein [Pluteus cervinus]
MTSHQATTALDLTYVIYDEGSHLSFILALLTLSPILLMASYAALSVFTREYIILVMWAGQFFGEGLNLVIKRLVKQDRPFEHLGSGYGFPSSHSQYMGYFTTFLLTHIYFRHRFTPTGTPILDKLLHISVPAVLLLWTSGVAYSRYHLSYHTPIQIISGLLIGSLLAIITYTLSYILPTKYPGSPLGQIYFYILDNPLSQFVGLRDGWAIWRDSGKCEEWVRWRDEWEKVKVQQGVPQTRKEGKSRAVKTENGRMKLDKKRH